MSKEIQITQGFKAIVDDEDYEYLNQFKWYVVKGQKTKYAVRYESPGKALLMHREILSATNPSEFIDHINTNGLDNRKLNLRFCTQAENQRNRGKQRNNTSGFKGVFWNKGVCKWIPAIRVDGRMIALGCFDCKIQAAKAYNAAALKYHGEFAYLNQIPE